MCPFSPRSHFRSIFQPKKCIPSSHTHISLEILTYTIHIKRNNTIIRTQFFHENKKETCSNLLHSFGNHRISFPSKVGLG